MVIKNLLQQNNHKKTARPLDFLFLLILIAAVPASLAIRLTFLEKNFGFDTDILFPFAVFSFLPLFLMNFLYGKRAAWIVGVLIGATQAIFITHHPGTFIFWALISFAMTSLSSLELNYRRKATNRWVQCLLIFLPLMIMVPVLLSFIMAVTTQGDIAGRINFVLGTVWNQTFIVWISFVINGVIAVILYGSGVLTAIKNDDKSKVMLRAQSSFILLVFLSIVWIILLFLATVVWKHSKATVVESVANELEQTSIYVLNNYTLFFEYGRNSIHETAQTLTGVTPDDGQNGNFDLLPFFNTLAVYDVQSGMINSLNHTAAITQLPEAVWDEIAVIDGGQLPYRVVAVASEDVLNPDTRFYFLAAIPGKPQTLIGMIDAKTHPMIQMSLQLFPDDCEWSVIDNQGGALFSSLMYADEIANSVQEPGEKTFSYHPETGYWVFAYAYGIGQFEARTTIAVNQSAIIDRQMKIIQPGILVLFSAGAVFSLVLLIALVLIQREIHSLAVDISQIGNEISGEFLNQNGILTQPIRHAIKNVHQQITRETSTYSDWVAFLHGLSLVNSYDVLIDYLMTASIFNAQDSIRFIIHPDIHNFLTNRHSNRFGKGALHEMMAVYDDAVELRLGNQASLSLQISKIQRQANTGRKTHEMPEYIQARAIATAEQNFGFVWLASVKPEGMQPIEDKFFNLFVKELSRVIAGFRSIQQIQTENRRTRSVIASMPEPIMVFDRELKLVLLNTAAEKLPGLQKNKIVQGTPMEALVVDPALKGFLNRTLQHRITAEELTLMDNKVYSGVLSIVSGAGQADWIICALHDVSAYQRKDAIRSEFLETVGKYLQMPFKMVKGYLGMLPKVGDLNKAQLDYAGLIQGNIDEMEHFVSGILDINRIRSGAGLKIESLFATDIIIDITKRIYPAAKQNKIALSIGELPARELTRFEVDEALFGQALFNLLDNAVKFNKRDGKVEVQLTIESGQFIFTIRDTGIGIAPLDLEKIFRAGSFEGSEPGTSHRGISLALSKSIIERHHGKIRVASWLGSGSVFTITMPPTQDKMRNAE